jgi:dipeptidyl aminopeptidase/acylaminoacyl peptidase
MRRFRSPLVLSLAAVAFWVSSSGAVAPGPQTVPTYQQFLSPASPLEVVAARKVDRIAWTSFQEGMRNAYTAAAPAFTPRRLTSFLKDDGIDLSDIQIADDGGTVVFLRGTAPNRVGWAANPSADPAGPERSVWASRTAGGAAWRVVDDAPAPELAPDGSAVLFVRDGQIHRAKVTPVRPASDVDRGEKPFIKAWGEQSGPKWSPDGRKIAFVSLRTDHSFVVVYDVATRRIRYMSPSVDFDASPLWTADSKSLVFVRQPGLAFGQQAQQGGGGLGNPNGPAYQPNAAAPGTGRGGFGRGGQGRGGQQAAAAGRGEGDAPPAPSAASKIPGLMQAAFKGGYTLAVWKADVSTGEAREVWHNRPNDRQFTTITNARLAGDTLVFPLVIGGGGRGGRGRGAQAEVPTQNTPAEPPASGPVDEWDRYYALNLSAADPQPVLLTTTDGLIEDQTSVAFSQDSKTLYYCTNAKDIERRHIWAVPIAGGVPPRQITSGDGIETYPAPLASGKVLATLSAGWNMPQSLGIWQLEGESPAKTGEAGRPKLDSVASGSGPGGMPSTQRIIYPTSRPGFPANAHVQPQIVLTKAADGLEIHNQLFLPKDIKQGEKRPAIVFVHGGPVRQMMPGYHYMQFYHWAYGINQWLASEGYVVLSVNYRSGIGYGRSFRTAPNTAASGNAEYQDVFAGGKYLQSRPDVDPNRVGIWGLSYGGLLTAEALARNSDLFKAGVDLAGVHFYGSSLDAESMSYKSSAVGAIDGWKSPVLLVHGDDDRNVAFQQTTGLVQLLRARDVYHELIVFPDDTHESMLYSRWMYTLERMDAFFKRFLGGGATTTSQRN